MKYDEAVWQMNKNIPIKNGVVTEPLFVNILFKFKTNKLFIGFNLQSFLFTCFAIDCPLNVSIKDSQDFVCANA